MPRGTPDKIFLRFFSMDYSKGKCHVGLKRVQGKIFWQTKVYFDSLSRLFSNLIPRLNRKPPLLLIRQPKTYASIHSFPRCLYIKIIRIHIHLTWKTRKHKLVLVRPIILLERFDKEILLINVRYMSTAWSASFNFNFRRNDKISDTFNEY